MSLHLIVISCLSVSPYLCLLLKRLFSLVEKFVHSLGSYNAANIFPQIDEQVQAYTLLSFGDNDYLWSVLLLSLFLWFVNCGLG